LKDISKVSSQERQRKRQKKGYRNISQTKMAKQLELKQNRTEGEEPGISRGQTSFFCV
jgi:hypothetical protein